MGAVGGAEGARPRLQPAVAAVLVLDPVDDEGVARSREELALELAI